MYFLLSNAVNKQLRMESLKHSATEDSVKQGD